MIKKPTAQTTNKMMMTENDKWKINRISKSVTNKYTQPQSCTVAHYVERAWLTNEYYYVYSTPSVFNKKTKLLRLFESHGMEGQQK